MTAIGLTSCKDFFDVNEDPNNPTDAPVELILPAAQASVAYTVGGSYHNLGGFWAQYYTQSPDAGQYEEIDEYNISPDFFDREWTEIYAGGLNDLAEVKAKADAEGNTSYSLIATLLKTYSMQMLVDMYGQIPYSTALQGDDGTFNPTFEDAEIVYPGLIAEIDQAMAAYEASNNADNNPSADDLFYGGDMNQWTRFANSLKLKMYMRMVHTSKANPTEVMNLVNADEFITIDAAYTDWGTQINKYNPYYEVQVDRLGGVNQAASNSIIKYLEDNGDPRLPVYFNMGGSTWTAKEQGDFANRDIPFSDLAQPNITATYPVYLMTVAEVNLLKAEAEVRYNGGANAKAAYDNAVMANFDMHNLGAAAANPLIESGGVYEFPDGGTDAEKIEAIMMQKWVCMVNTQNVEAWIEINRNHIPAYSSNAAGTPGAVGELTISYASTLPAGQTPKRLLIPDVEVSRNSNAPAQPAQGHAAKVWWDQK
jgi:hypothetical protein